MTLTLKNLPLKKQHCMIVASVAFIAILTFVFDSSIADLFVYQHQLISQGELWRTFTGHFFHTNGFHLLFNLAALILLWALHGHFYSLKNYSLLFITSALICSAGLYYLSPDIRQYVGLSGVLHGIFVFGAIMDIRHQDKTGYLLFIGVWLKIAHEQFYGASKQVSTLINASVAIDAHLWGAIGGLIFSCCYLIYLFNRKK
ncbi:rhombosortase [Colwellia psychrerythraea]|uniref:Rhomboid-like serine protease, proteobacteria n=1 Tax=Colwellia psychrerythraea TaxID=28229 RepID=A0A099KJS3_COLPS|nr:rhombosortase [Colwellia psychrerythraea]KGJ89858.1 Rhomboid-like serine protease, proteobacteria [Colwellia psychrerythraea]